VAVRHSKQTATLIPAKESLIVEIRFTVWQFVRLMVHLEESTDISADQSALKDSWNDQWQPLDQELGELAERDFEAYGELMMDQDVVIEDATAGQALIAGQVIERVQADMDQAIEAGGEPAHLQNLKFERRELRQLARKLSRMTDDQA